MSFIAYPGTSATLPTLASCALQSSALASSVTSSWFSPSKCPEATYLAEPFADDNAYDQSSTVVMLLRGLSKNASFTLTCRTVIQRVVGANSTLSAVVKPPMEPDQRALEAYYAIASHMKYAYPAKYNSLAAVLPLVGQALKTLAPHLLPVAAMAAQRLLSSANPAQPPQQTFRPRLAAKATKRVQIKAKPARKRRKSLV